MQLTRDQIRALLDEERNTVISVYIPTERKAYRPEQNALRFRSALDGAAERLQERGLPRPEIDAFLSPLRDMLDDRDFWLHQADGLALFRSESDTEMVKLPWKPSESIRVGRAPYLVPLLEGLSVDETHALLALSQDEIRLFSCTAENTEEIDTGDLDFPRSLAEALRYDDLQKPGLQHRPTTGPGRGAAGKGARGNDRTDRRHGFHGHGEGGEDQKKQIEGYLRSVDAALRPRLREFGSPPLILAGVEYVHAIFRNVSKYPSIVDISVNGNPGGLRPDELLQRIAPVMRAHKEKRLTETLSRFRELEAHDLATAKLAEVVDAADVGRVDTLVVQKDAVTWGTLDPQTRTVTRDKDHQQVGESEDLIDLAARRTLSNDGTVIVLDPGNMVASEAGVAALLRY